ncbi:hypothetical protein [Anaerospora hongkongensis]|uniref:hypothetical protein n=1 Tax=Anaerospora hongkongensis TaxID=244830 RepID=UPI002FDB88CE
MMALIKGGFCTPIKSSWVTADIIKDMPQDIRKKLTDEPEYTIRDAFVEAEVLAVEVSGEFHDGEITYDVLKSIRNAEDLSEVTGDFCGANL